MCTQSKGSGKNNFIVSFQRDSKTTYRIYVYRILTSALFCGIFLLEILSCLPSWIFVDIHDTSQVGSRNFFFTKQ